MSKKVGVSVKRTSQVILLVLVVIGTYLAIDQRFSGRRSIACVDKPVENRFRNYSNQTYNIPMIIHQTYATERVRFEYKAIIANCLRLNPQWKYYLWRDEDIDLFVQTHFPWLMNKYKSLKMKIEKSDIIRYMILYHYGGIYIDMDVECIKPFYPWMTSVGPAFLDQERYEQARVLHGNETTVMNSAMGSVPQHPFFLTMLVAIDKVQPDAVPPTGTTGPFLLTEVYFDWVRNQSSMYYPVTLLEPEVFSPRVDGDFPKFCKSYSFEKDPDPPNKIRWRKIGCQAVLSGCWKSDTTDAKITVGRHLFSHIGWYPESSRHFRFNIRELIPKVKFYKEHRMAPSKGSELTRENVSLHF